MNASWHLHTFPVRSGEEQEHLWAKLTAMSKAGELDHGVQCCPCFYWLSVN